MSDFKSHIHDFNALSKRIMLESKRKRIVPVNPALDDGKSGPKS
jgi:hypothetical protein